MDTQSSQSALTPDFINTISTTTIQPVDLSLSDGDIQQQIGILRRCWCYERGCGMLLPYPEYAIHNAREVIQHQETLLFEDHVYHDVARSVYELELARLQYLVHDLHRIRLRKIELKPLYYAFDAMGKEKLSPAELQFATGYAKIVQDLMKVSLEGLPGKYSQDCLQYETPDENEIVLLRTFEGLAKELDIPNQRSIVPPNTIIVAPYNHVLAHIEDGELDVV